MTTAHAERATDRARERTDAEMIDGLPTYATGSIYEADAAAAFDDDPVAVIEDNETSRAAFVKALSEIVDEVFANPEDAAEIRERWKLKCIKGV